jgi:hypothetical protein
MSAETRSHIRSQASSNAFFNAVINGWIAWLLMKGNAVLPMWGTPGVGPDLVATGFLLPFIIALIVIPLNRRAVRRGKVAALRADRLGPRWRWLGRWPEGLFVRALLFGLAGALLVAPLTLLGFALLGVRELTPMTFAVFKGLWAGALAGVMVVPMALLGISRRE